MIRALLSSLCLCVLSAAVSAQQTVGSDRAGTDQQTRHLWFTVAIEPESTLSSGAYVDGQIVMDIRFESYDPFKRLRLMLPEIDGARVTTLVRPHTLQINMMGGKGYSHVTRLAIVPDRAGILLIPPIRVSGISQARSGRSFEFEQTHPQQRITVHPPTAEFIDKAGGKAWIVSQQATLEQSWTPDISTLRSGDTVRRRIALSVAGVTAGKLAPLTLASNTGYRVLSSEPSTRTEQTETGFIAHLEQVWDIYIEADGVFYIDAVQFPYWNPELASTEILTAPRQRIEPLLRDAAELRQQLREAALAGHRARRFGLTALLALPLFGLVVILALLVRQALPTPADLRLWRASRRAGPPLNFYAAFQAWGRQTLAGAAGVDRERIASLGAPALDQVEHMQQTIFGGRGGDFDAKLTALRLIRASCRTRVRRFLAAIVPRISRLLFLR
jgi:hypothetical protein